MVSALALKGKIKYNNSDSGAVCPIERPGPVRRGGNRMEWLLNATKQMAANVVSNFGMISISDIVDIAIMAFLIYKLIDLIRTTSSGKVMRGILLLVAAVVLSSAFHLYTFNWLLSKVLEIGVLAIVILFQPELRKLLEQVGSSTIGNVFSSRPATPDDMESAITQTVEAYTELSRTKTGALMVFERRNTLDEQIRTGTTLDAAVNAELLKNLFWNKAPLHDGAVIVREGRIVAAGCMLPMSGNLNLSKELGMRHRAGIGMSESSDAVVAIVSEETGSISVAVGGMLKRHLAPETLERLLRNELMPQESASDKDNFFEKVTGLLRGRKEAKTDGE